MLRPSIVTTFESKIHKVVVVNAVPKPRRELEGEVTMDDIVLGSLNIKGPNFTSTVKYNNI